MRSCFFPGAFLRAPALAIVLVLLVVPSGFPSQAAGGSSVYLPLIPGAPIEAGLALSLQFSGLTSPVYITHAGDGSGRIFVVEQQGRIRVIQGGALLPAPFLDITSRVKSGGELGLLSVAFPPGYAAKRYFYVYYTDFDDDTVVARYRVSADPNIADPNSEEIVLAVEQPYDTHKGGQLAFGPLDGYLYIGMGDGGSIGDPGNRAQDPSLLLGKFLRIDVESGVSPYLVPPTNPFVGAAGYRPEIWAVGLRNPWRYSFDRQTGDLYIGDVGQATWEEIDFQPATSSGGENYGWRIMEGTHCYNPATGCDTTGLVLPVAEYHHMEGCSVVGGYVYRGTAYPRLQGTYFYGDYCSGVIWGLRRAGANWANVRLLTAPISISTFGEDESGRLYVADYGAGDIYEIVEAP